MDTKTNTEGKVSVMTVETEVANLREITRTYEAIGQGINCGNGMGG